MTMIAGGSYALNPMTSEYELVARTLDPAEVFVPDVVDEPAPSPSADASLKAAKTSKTSE
jgi:hypothetical protein